MSRLGTKKLRVRSSTGCKREDGGTRRNRCGGGGGGDGVWGQGRGRSETGGGGGGGGGEMSSEGVRGWGKAERGGGARR
ncbi:hypothetical protein B1218_33515 [Pseudomonas ogarae]|nr:hypothetical protein B1218_33515 [Pseudomonas ogarae]